MITTEKKAEIIKEYQTKENGVYIKLPADYAAKANTYLLS